MNAVNNIVEFKLNNDSFSNGQQLAFHFWQKGQVDFHSHEYFELFLITEGKVIHYFNDTSAVLEKGTLCVMKPYDAHAFEQIEGISTVHFNLKITPSLFEMLCSAVSPSLFGDIMERSEFIKCKLKGHEYDYIIRVLQDVNCGYPSKTDKEALPIIRTVAVNFLMCINALLKTEKKDCPKWLSNYLEVLNSPESFSKPLSQLYALSGYSQTRLNAYVRKYTGMTLISYITKRKINYACNLLKTTNYSVIKISLMAGFNNLSNFNSVFKRITGKTPTEYRTDFSTIMP